MRGLVEALTFIRNGRKIDGTYRIKDMRWSALLEHSGVKRRGVNLEVSC